MRSCCVNAWGHSSGWPMAEKGPPAAFAREPYKVKPRNTANMRPIAQAIQIALFRTDRGDNIPRIIKIGERLVRDAVAGDNEALAFIRDMYEGKTKDSSGDTDPGETLGSVAIVELLKHLIEQKREGATIVEAKIASGRPPVTDVVADMVERSRKE